MIIIHSMEFPSCRLANEGRDLNIRLISGRNPKSRENKKGNILAEMDCPGRINEL